MNRDEELKRIEDAAGCYNSERLAGPNELYHLYVRDILIPENGGGSALELGCGKGLWTKVLCERYDTVDVADGSGELLEKVLAENRERKATLTVHTALVEEFIRETEKRWDHIYMTFLLEHLTDPVAVLNDIQNCLNENGMLFVAVPNALSVHRMIAVRMGLNARPDELSENDVLVGHRRIYTPELLRSQLVEAGFGIVDLRTVTLKPLSLGQMEKWPDELVRAFCESGDLAPWHGAYIIAAASRYTGR